MTSYSYISIEGNIGAGKTTLANMLARHLNAHLVLEEFADNPFLEKFYKSPAEYAFPLEISFLVERFAQLQRWFSKPDLFQQKIVADYFFNKCEIFARTNLTVDQFSLFQKLFNTFSRQLPKPDLVIYLHNKIPLLQKNISARGREFERDLTEDYLIRIEESYLQYFRTSSEYKVLYLDVTRSDFLAEPGLTMKLMQHINRSWPAGLSFLEM